MCQKVFKQTHPDCIVIFFALFIQQLAMVLHSISGSSNTRLISLTQDSNMICIYVVVYSKCN